MATLDVCLLPRVDESGVNLAMTRLYGRALRGTRGIGGVPQNDGQNVTRLSTLGAQGLQAVMTVDSATDAEVFQTYVKRVLRPTLRPGDIVVMDKLRAHQAVGVQQALACRGAHLVCLSPYLPELSPGEPCWSKVTMALRTAKARTCDAVEHGQVMPSIGSLERIAVALGVRLGQLFAGLETSAVGAVRATARQQLTST
jgi:hypothetical protein